jgi:hypothetical protein
MRYTHCDSWKLPATVVFLLFSESKVRSGVLHGIRRFLAYSLPPGGVLRATSKKADYVAFLVYDRVGGPANA